MSAAAKVSAYDVAVSAASYKMDREAQNKKKAEEDDARRKRYEAWYARHTPRDTKLKRKSRRANSTSGRRPSRADRPKWPIGTWKSPYGNIGGRYIDAPVRGVSVVGTGKPKQEGH